MSATVLLASTMPWPFPAQLAGAFAQAGARVEALAPAQGMLAASRYPAALHRYHPLRPHASLRRALRRANPDLIIPCDDLAGELIQRVRGDAFAGRLDFLTRAAQAGAPVGETLALSGAAQLEEAIARLGLPLVVKSDNSWGGDGVVIAATRQEAEAAFHKFRRASRLRDVARAIRRQRSHFLTRALFPVRPALSAQRFIDGHPATSSIACWQGALVAAHHFDVVMTSLDTGPASVVAPTACPQMAQAAEAIAAAFNLSGLFGLDYIRDRSGAVHLLEMNARATPTSHLALTQDLPAALLRAAGFAARQRPAVTGKDKIALFPREWLRDPASDWLKTAFHDVPWDDAAVVRASLDAAPPEARALLETVPGAALTTQTTPFGA